MGSVGTERSYDSYSKTVTDTLIVERNGRYQIEPYNGQNLDEYDHAGSLNHDQLVTWKVNSNSNNPYFAEVMKDISLKDIYDYLRKRFNFRG